VVNKISAFVARFQAVIGIVAALAVAIMAFNEEMKKHYPVNPATGSGEQPE
jgi:hypothetical protein